MDGFAYAGKILNVDLSDGKSGELATADYSGKYLGGRGIAARLFWETVPPDTAAFDPDNCLIYATGPVTGFFGLAGCRWVICSKTPLRQPESFSYGNLGGKWGSGLKYSGFDALAVRGRAERPVYLYIHEGTVEMKDASSLWGLSTFATAEHITAELGKGVSVLAIGPAAESRVVFATALADAGASVSGGIPSVMGSKNLKAIAVAGNKRPKAAHHEKLKQLAEMVRQIRGSTFDGPSPWAIPGLTRQENCYGCGIGCSRQSYRGEDGRRYKNFCQAAGFYTMPAMNYYGKSSETPLLATRLNDSYGLDSASMAPLVSWLTDCYREGIITEAQTGLPLSKVGSEEFIEALTRVISHREGFGDVLAAGTLAAAATLGEKALELASKYVTNLTGETRDYDPRLILTTALMYATEPRRPVSQLHGISGNILISWASWANNAEGSFFSTTNLRTAAERFWGGAKAVDFSTYEGKALAAKKVQDRSCVNESLVLCDVHWPMTITSAECPAGHVGDPALESRIYSAVTGREPGEEELYRTGERIYNLQRAIQIRNGWGGRDGDHVLEYFFTHPLKRGEAIFNPDGIMPGPDGEIISRLDKVLDRDKFQEMLTEYYQLRGWDTATGYPTTARLRELGLDDIISDLSGL